MIDQAHSYRPRRWFAGPAAAAAIMLACMSAERSVPDESANWSVEERPLLDIGGEGADTNETFGQVVGAARLANGDVVVADRQHASLRYFGVDGRLIRVVGRRGSGPGEFSYVARMLRCGDSLFIKDIGTQRYSVYSIAGAFGRDFTFVTLQPARSAYNTVCNEDRVFLSHGWENQADMKPGPYRSQVPYWLSAPDGRVTAKLGEHPGSERFGTSRDGRLTGSRPQPLGKQPLIAAGRSRVYLGTADSFFVATYDLAGNPLRPVTKSRVELRTTPEDVERVIALDTAGQPPSRQAHLLAELQTMEFPATIPAYAALVVDSEDHLWVQTYARPALRASRWIVFSPSGEEVGRIDLPLDLQVYEIGRDYVLGRQPEPQDGVDHVVVYGLRRGKDP